MEPTAVLLPGESPWTEEPGELQSMGSQELDTTEQQSTTQPSTTFVIALLLKTKNLLISWLQSSCIVILCSHKPERKC